jgi:hypothetical protein
MVVICKDCGKEMELDFTEGISYTESHYYVCECGVSCTIHENLADTEWKETSGQITCW